MKQAIKDFGAGTLLVIGVVVVALVIGVGLWVFRVATSDIKGRGDAEVTKNSALNRVGAQERFEDLYQEVQSADQRIDVAAAAYDADPSTVNQTNLTGIQSYCLDVIGDYNAEARKFSAAEFRAADLPESIDTTSLATDCKPSKETTR